LGGNNIGTKGAKTFCSFNGFMIQTFVVQSKQLYRLQIYVSNAKLADYWVLTIAVCTYLILANHKYQSSWIQEHRLITWVLPWVLSTMWASIGLAVVGYGDIGACKYSRVVPYLVRTLTEAGCWFTSDRVRLLVNFLPRWLIIIAILGLYLRLYFIIHKAHTRFMSFDEDATGSLQMESSTTRSAPRVSLNVSSGTDGCEAGRPTLPTHSRIGRPSPVLKRVGVPFQIFSNHTYCSRYPIRWWFILWFTWSSGLFRQWLG
jgi:hypothetical protein